MIKAVSFDVGETIVEETLEYNAWADWLGVPRHTFSAVFGAVIARGEDYREVFEFFRPGFVLSEERQKRKEAGQPESFGEENLYPDVRPALETLSMIGIKLGFAGNQTKRAEEILRNLFPELDTIDTSDSLGVEKPSEEFFYQVAESVGFDLDEILYVGDRLDNDIAPAQAVGMPTAFIKRGPWGYILNHPTADKCLFEINSLTELAPLIQTHNNT